LFTTVKTIKFQEHFFITGSNKYTKIKLEKVVLDVSFTGYSDQLILASWPHRAV